MTSLRNALAERGIHPGQRDQARCGYPRSPGEFIEPSARQLDDDERAQAPLYR